MNYLKRHLQLCHNVHNEMREKDLIILKYCNVCEDKLCNFTCDICDSKCCSDCIKITIECNDCINKNSQSILYEFNKSKTRKKIERKRE